MRCYIFDIDGTIADLSHRLPHIQKEPKDWDAFFGCVADDAPMLNFASKSTEPNKGNQRHD